VNEQSHRPDIHVAPPLLFATGFVAGYLLHRFWIAINIAGDARDVRMIGIALLILGTALAFWGVSVFRRAKTTILPFRASTAIVRDGPYRFTRNPMYVGMTLGYLGASLVVNSPWPIIVLPFVLIALTRLVITREEAFLTATFGDEYITYTRQVRRWL